MCFKIKSVMPVKDYANLWSTSIKRPLITGTSRVAAKSHNGSCGRLMPVQLWKNSVDSFPFSFANRKWIRSWERIVHCLPSLTKRNALIKKWTFPERPAESFCQTYSLSGKTSQQAFSCQSLRWFFFFKFLNGTDSNLEKLGRPLIDVHTLFKVVKCLLCDWNKKKNIELPNSPLPESKKCSKTVRKGLWASND